MKTPPLPTGCRFVNLTGHTYGQLTVISYAGQKPPKTQCYWNCRCSCGNMTVVKSNKLRSGATRSCSCLQKAVRAALNRSHGMSNSPEYHAWAALKARCYSKANIAYRNYGGRGIKVCRRWLKSFANFYADMGPRPSSTHSVDRRDPNKNYCPSNCYWATAMQQGTNKRNNHYITFGGERLTLAQWSRRTGLEPTVICLRLTRLGWSVKKALTTPVRKSSRSKTP